MVKTGSTSPLSKPPFFLFAVLLLVLVGAPESGQAADRVGRLAASFDEQVDLLVVPGKEASLSELRAPQQQSDWVIDYQASAGESRVIPLPVCSGPAERLDFYLKADGSGNFLRLDVFYAPTQRWIEQAVIKLNWNGWQHLVVPAGNPLHAFHQDVPKLRFRVASGGEGSAATGRVVVRRLATAWTKPVKEALPQDRPPAPIFDTWGGPRPSQFPQAAVAGVTTHLLPVDFPDGRPVADRVRYAAKAIQPAHAAGLTVGLAFYATPPAVWLSEHPELLCRGKNGVYDRPGGAFLSPWNPEAEKLLTDHIRDVLRYLQSRSLLDAIEVVELCPGEEGEISFEWHQVWAFDPHAITAYRQFLRCFYSDDVEALNRDWVTEYSSFQEISPPHDYRPDREHWVFTEFYRASLLRRCVVLAAAVADVFEPRYWLWMPHSVGNSKQRFFSARYPAYYAENLRRLGCADYVHLAAVDWQTPADVRHLQTFGVRAIAEVDVRPTPERLRWTFEQAQRLGCDGVFLGVMEGLVEGDPPSLTENGRLAQNLSDTFRGWWQETSTDSSPPETVGDGP